MNRRLIAISFAYPPEMSAMAILVWRLLRHSGSRFSVVCGSRGVASDHGLAGMAGDGAEEVIYVPFRENPLHLLARRVLSRTPLVRMLEIPDIYRPWVPRATAAALALKPDRSDVLVTFASPMSDHLAGLSIRRNNPGIPWVAYFGDPWTRNPMIKSDTVARAANRRMERAVVHGADLLVFPCEEMSILTLRGYNSSIHDKSRVVSHGFEETLYPPDRHAASPNVFTIRHLGSLYGSRTPSDLGAAMRLLQSTAPGVAGRIRFEFYGYHSSAPDAAEYPPDTFSFHPAVGYLESLDLMRTADALLVITPTEADSGAFLPSKLIDYTGARRPIIGICRPGVCTTLIKNLGGWVSGAGDPAKLAGNLGELVAFLSTEEGNRPWGDESVRAGYTAEKAGRVFAGFIEELL